MLSSLNIVIPIYHLISMFETGVDSVLAAQEKRPKKSTSSEKEGDSEDEEPPELGH